MAHKAIYDTTQRNFRLVAVEPGDYFFNVYNVHTNLRVAILNAEDATFRFVDKDASLSCRQLSELMESAKAIQPNFKDQ